MNAHDSFSLAVGKFYDSSEPVWGLRSAEQKFKNADGEIFYHSFSILTDETDPQTPRILDELHFIPLVRLPDGRMMRAVPQTQTARPWLGAAVYQNPARRLTRLPNILYARDVPLRMMRQWNQACRTALKIAALGRPFDETYNCRAGTKTVIEGLGYTFRTFAEPKMQRGMHSPLASELGAPATDETYQNPVSEHEYLRLQLTLPRRLRAA